MRLELQIPVQKLRERLKDRNERGLPWRSEEISHAREILHRSAGRYRSAKALLTIVPGTKAQHSCRNELCRLRRSVLTRMANCAIQEGKIKQLRDIRDILEPYRRADKQYYTPLWQRVCNTLAAK